VSIPLALCDPNELQARPHVTAGRIPPVWTDSVLTPTQIVMKAIHILELYNAVIALE
jgi:hypothetical protein